MATRKKPLIFITVLVAAVLLVAGTFAWQQMVHKVNEFTGSKNGEVLHDDFNPNTGEKEVYVENTGTGELFIRVKLNETMDLTSNERPSDPIDWKSHVYKTSYADCGNSNDNGDLFHKYFNWVMGGQKYYMPANGSEPVVQDTNIYNGGTPGVGQTPLITANQLITVETYLSMSTAEKSAFKGWIFDNDGYIYWSQPLKKDEVTGLLLNRVDTDPSLNDTDYYYAIDVISEAVDIKDIRMWTEGAESVDGSGKHFPEATTAGKAVISSIVALASTANAENAIAMVAEPLELEGADLSNEDVTVPDENPASEDSAENDTSGDEDNGTDTLDGEDAANEENPADDELEGDSSAIEEPAGDETSGNENPAPEGNPADEMSADSDSGTMVTEA
ncbi:MAG: hypothetical protein FWD71_03145 [Oscillospiraceae bacterium]|nr:hypothetical protein [Oscillospiraceae bacterium]